MTPQDIVAIILAVSVLLFLMLNTALGYKMLGPDFPEPSDTVIEGWLNLVNVIIGALAGYIAGRTGQ